MVMKRFGIVLAALMIPGLAAAQEASWRSNDSWRVYKPISGFSSPFEVQCQSTNSSDTPIRLVIPRQYIVSTLPHRVQVEVFDRDQKVIYRDTITDRDQPFGNEGDRALGLFIYNDTATDGSRFITSLIRGSAMRVRWTGPEQGEFSVTLNGITAPLHRSYCRR